MEITGIVTKLNKNYAFVSSSCTNCSTCVSKDACSVNMLTDGSSKIIEALNTKEAKVGDKVLIHIPPSRAISAATIIYILPLFIMIIGYFIGFYLTNNEKGGAIGCILGILVGFGLVKGIDNLFRKHKVAEIKRILPPN